MNFSKRIRRKKFHEDVIRVIKVFVMLFIVMPCASYGSDRWEGFDGISPFEWVKARGWSDAEAELIISLSGFYLAGLEEGYCKGKDWGEITNYQFILNRGLYSVVSDRAGQIAPYVLEASKVNEIRAEHAILKIEKVINAESAQDLKKRNYICIESVDASRKAWSQVAMRFSGIVGKQKKR